MKYNKAITVWFAISLALSATAQTPSLSLADCKRLALEQNKKIQAAQMDISAAKTAVESAKLNDRPSFDASLMGINVGKPLTSLLPTVMANASVDVKQALYAGGKIKLGVAASEKVVEIYEGQKALTESEVLLSVENAYWQIVQVKEKIVLANKYKEMLLGLRKDLQNSFDAGMIYKNDLLRVEVSLNEAELNLSKANDGWVLAKLNLAQIIGQAGNSSFTITDSVAGDFNGPAQPSLGDEVVKRPEINLLKKSIEAEQLQTRLIKADLKPTIGLSASGVGAFGKKVNFSNGNNSMFTYYALASISVPIFDWGKNAKKVKEQNLKIQAKQVQLDETKELIQLQVQNAYLQLHQSVKKINLSQLSLQQAEENLRLANDRYRAGTIVGKDVLEAQAIWQQAYTSVIDAKVEYKINEAGYRKAIGEMK